MRSKRGEKQIHQRSGHDEEGSGVEPFFNTWLGEMLWLESPNAAVNGPAGFSRPSGRLFRPPDQSTLVGSWELPHTVVFHRCSLHVGWVNPDGTPFLRPGPWGVRSTHGTARNVNDEETHRPFCLRLYICSLCIFILHLSWEVSAFFWWLLAFGGFCCCFFFFCFCFFVGSWWLLCWLLAFVAVGFPCFYGCRAGA